jgi:hypothetical protein
MFFKERNHKDGVPFINDETTLPSTYSVFCNVGISLYILLYC